MRHTIKTKLLSLLLVLALLMSYCPMGYASEALPEEHQATVETVEETEATEPSKEVTEPVEKVTEPTQETTEVTEETTEPTEETAEPTQEATEATEETTVPTEETTEPTEEATEPVEELVALPYGLKGLPEDYTLSEEALAEKEEMASDDGIRSLDTMEAGEDYEEDTLIIHAETEEEAELFAEAYNAELLDYDYGTGLIRLSDVSVAEAVEAAKDMTLPLPAVSPNYVVELDPILTESGLDSTTMNAMENTPTRMDWNAWVNEVMDDPDPALLSPAGRYSGGYAFWNDIYQYMHDVVDSYAAWGVSTGSDVKVAVIDSGVNTDHPELKGKVTSYDIGFGTSDQQGHGTSVAGVIAASMNNGQGGAGIAPDAEILNIRVLSQNGSTNDYYIAKGIRKAIAEEADVINLSMGGIGISQDLRSAIYEARVAGITIVAAMGNGGMTQINYPAACDGVIGVVATDVNNTRAQYSNYGSWADVAAPGTAIFTTDSNGDYAVISGTSVASPVVAGVVALYKSANPYATPSEIEARLKSTATKAGSDTGSGIVNAAKMLSEKPDAPIIAVFDEDGDMVGATINGTLGQHVPCESTLVFSTTNDDRNYFLVYTFDGKTPAVKNGQVITGTVYDWDEIDLSDYAGKTITVKVMQVNGMGMAGSVTTKKLTIDQTVEIEKVTISGPQFIISGKKGEYKAVVEPGDKANQAVYWTIVPGQNTDKYTFAREVSIDKKTGLLTTSKNSYGLVQIAAFSQVDSSKVGVYVAFVRPMNATGQITLNSTKVNCFIDDTIELKVRYATDANGNFMDMDYLSFRWSSSNTKVAIVDENGKVTAVGKGSAVITCKSLDGSGKTTKCTVNVKQPVTELNITGQSTIAPGSSATYKVTAYPASANDKSVRWGLVQAPWGVTIDQKGTVKVASYTARGSVFAVVAVAKDGSGAQIGYVVTVQEKCTGVSLWYEDAPGLAPGVTTSKGKLTGVGLFNVALNNAPTNLENEIQLTAVPIGSPNVEIEWTSNKSNVASVDQNGLVTAHKPGSATITAMAKDGSKKKASVTVKVTVPVSSMTLNSSAVKGDQDMPVLAVGKSYTHTVSFGSLYGTPSNKNVKWSWQGYTTNSNSDLVDITSALDGYVTCSKGKLTVKSKAVEVLSVLEDLYVTVFASSMDGTRVVASKTYQVLMPTTMLAWYGGYGYDSSAELYYYTFFSDQYHSKDGNGHPFSNFSVTSSKPNVVNPVQVVGVGYDSWRGAYEYRLYFDVIDHGKSKITITTTDGTKKSISRTMSYR